MQLRRSFCAGFFLILAAGCEPPSYESQHAGLKYEPAPAASTTCMPCNPIHGACNPMTCKLDCTTGFGDCDGDLTNGCESVLTDPGSCGTCSNNCKECFEAATCNNGACGGRQRPNGSVCVTPSACVMDGVCIDGACTCPVNVDMARNSPIGFVPTDMARAVPKGADLPGCSCDVSRGGTATASLVLLLSSTLLLWRRRRS